VLNILDTQRYLIDSFDSLLQMVLQIPVLTLDSIHCFGWEDAETPNVSLVMIAGIFIVIGVFSLLP
jgi:hypothetical protein